MTVDELREELKNVDGNRIVVMSKDAEGNSFSPLEDMDDNSTYKADSTWAGEIGIEKLTEELRNRGFGDSDVIGGEPALILWPVN